MYANILLFIPDTAFFVHLCVLVQDDVCGHHAKAFRSEVM